MWDISIEKKRQIIRLTTIFGIILTIVGSIYIARSSYFRPGGGFSDLLIRLGIWAPIIFITVQISQIIYPIIPFGLTNVVGDLVFGHGWGFIYNCIGMLIGSSINFYLGRRFGEGFVKAFISDEQYDKYIGKMNDGPGFTRLLKIGFVLPIFPDDIFCMIAGMSNMMFNKFFMLVALYRPLSLFVFTFLSSNVIKFFADLLIN
ncbi:TVP38/TMEM64 family protein [Fundicoccus culcitae]|uniref:TVP38/TMEM64 family membrane protein n=1 Tax=Fundicoccus culcitae TaxID=2969821 RepID=A0ABY5P2V9_9LACT|nr:VTT domain-containing protein [Fundicoccus culcitae]UUX32989.1 VTT domain-containing protein [Fundicoccus culcitae]